MGCFIVTFIVTTNKGAYQAHTCLRCGAKNRLKLRNQDAVIPHVCLRTAIQSLNQHRFGGARPSDDMALGIGS